MRVDDKVHSSCKLFALDTEKFRGKTSVLGVVWLGGFEQWTFLNRSN